MRKGQTLKKRTKASWSEQARYRAYAATLQSKKEFRNGLVGINFSGSSWRVYFPYYLRIKTRHFRTALEAAIAYNVQVQSLFGEHAVLCDVNAAMEADRKYKK